MQADLVDFFFAEPTEELVRHQRADGRLSTLYLVRREAQDCLVGTVISEDELFGPRSREQHRLFATVIVLLAGIDLLGKLFTGFHDADVKDNGLGARRRFLEFAHDCMELSESAAESLWWLRNALMHSFGLYDWKAEKSIALAQSCDEPDEEAAPVRESDSQLEVCVEHLFRAFIHSVRKYRKLLESSDELQARFERLFPLYGTVRMELQ